MVYCIHTEIVNRTNDNLPQKKMTEMLTKEGEDTTKKMLKMQVQGKQRNGSPKKRWMDNIREDTKRVRDDGRHGGESKCVTHEDKGRLITTWRRPIGFDVFG